MNRSHNNNNKVQSTPRFQKPQWWQQWNSSQLQLTGASQMWSQRRQKKKLELFVWLYSLKRKSILEKKTTLQTEMYFTDSPNAAWVSIEFHYVLNKVYFMVHNSVEFPSMWGQDYTHDWEIRKVSSTHCTNTPLCVSTVKLLENKKTQWT